MLNQEKQDNDRPSSFLIRISQEATKNKFEGTTLRLLRKGFNHDVSLSISNHGRYEDALTMEGMKTQRFGRKYIILHLEETTLLVRLQRISLLLMLIVWFIFHYATRNTGLCSTCLVSIS